ncbi:class 1 isoprenoid biosynthesis enzyme [Paenibacillus prosopidis]|uniref:Polyprenyl synthetase n=1 Tax=Paenibacillus prosopidis TaxID=630520 RepID=A0A368VRP5_9BACL|nr:class 1 isoprenoid biosynthesis enzyme [Paenibacillus prosopidis]RCW44337.1 hypothetical protein DFP97_112203 [Paenibacillus prosopidis]
MEWYNRYKQQLEFIYSEAERRIAAFPSPLNTIGLAYADKFNPVKHESGKDYICCLLPFWIKEPAAISDEQCQRLALANIYGMLYFFIQDDVMDSSPSSNWKEQLALGNLLVLEMFSVFRPLFPSNSPFWDYYNRYVTTWADSVMNEQNDDYFVNNPIRTAGKAGPVKIASTGALLLSGRDELIGTMEEAVDIVLMTLQMSDDWADWKEDLTEGSYNGLLAMIAAGGAVKEPLTFQEVESSIYVRGCMKQYANIASDNHEQLLSLRVEAGELLDFHAYLVNHLDQIAETLDTNRLQLLKGGLNYFLSTKSIKKVL